MRGPTHVTCGYLACAVIATAMGPGLSHNIGNAIAYPLVYGVISSTGSLLPDIDLHSSTMGRKHVWVSKLLTHRGITHTLLVPVILAILCYLSSQVAGEGLSTMLFNISFGILVGWMTHIIADLFNRKGVPLLWPVYRKRVHVFTVTTGTWQEPVWLFFMVVATGVYVFLAKGGAKYLPW